MTATSVDTRLRQAIKQALLDADLVEGRVFVSMDRRLVKDDLPALIIWIGDTRAEDGTPTGRSQASRMQEFTLECAISCVTARKAADASMADAEDRASDLGAQVQSVLAGLTAADLPGRLRVVEKINERWQDSKSDLLTLHRVLVFEYRYAARMDAAGTILT